MSIAAKQEISVSPRSQAEGEEKAGAATARARERGGEGKERKRTINHRERCDNPYERQDGFLNDQGAGRCTLLQVAHALAKAQDVECRNEDKEHLDQDTPRCIRVKGPEEGRKEGRLANGTEGLRLKRPTHQLNQLYGGKRVSHGAQAAEGNATYEIKSRH